MANTSYLSAGQAAKEAGVSKATISKALTSGRLSYVEKNARGYRIDPAELFRVYPRNGRPNGSPERSETPGEPAGEPSQVKLLQAQLQAEREKSALLEAQLKREQDTVDDLRRRLPPPARPEPTPGLWGRLRGWARPAG